MSQITAAQVKSLRDRTDQPMMDCKKALVETGGDMDKAIEFLRAKSKNITVKRADKEVAEGRIAACVVGDVGAIIEVRCESAPVAKTEQFVDMCNDLAKHVCENEADSVEALLAQSFSDGKTVQERVEDVIGLIREKMEVARFERLTGGKFGFYCHHDGSVGVLVQAEGDGDAAILRDVSMHVTATNPIAGTRDEVPADLVEKEREIAIAQTREDPKMEGKPDEIVEKASQGKLNKWLAQNVLVDQPFVKDESKKVGQLFKDGGLTLKKFVRFKVGEKI